MMIDWVGLGVGLGFVGVGVGDGDGLVGVGDGDVAVTAGAMVTLNVFEAAVPVAGVAVTVTEKEPDAVGVPLIAPAVLIVSPAGSPVAA